MLKSFRIVAQESTEERESNQRRAGLVEKLRGADTYLLI
jgi:hypothetical protein